ncbi:MAG: hypothetical protein HC804_10540 [Anaerolineae bacterium]|nr:hypothetical protein [Anaerolineae bacterium]
MPLTFPKLFAGALAPFLALFGLIGAVLGLFTRAPFAVGAGLFALLASGQYVWRVAKSGGDFDAAFGPHCQKRIPESRREHMLPGRWTWRPATPPEPRWQQNLCFWTLRIVENRNGRFCAISGGRR